MLAGSFHGFGLGSTAAVKGTSVSLDTRSHTGGFFGDDAFIPCVLADHNQRHIFGILNFRHIFTQSILQGDIQFNTADDMGFAHFLNSLESQLHQFALCKGLGFAVSAQVMENDLIVIFVFCRVIQIFADFFHFLQVQRCTVVADDTLQNRCALGSGNLLFQRNRYDHRFTGGNHIGACADINLCGAGSNSQCAHKEEHQNQ